MTVQINVKGIRMKNFDQKELSGLSKKEWSEPQMTKLSVKQTETGSSQWKQEAFDNNGNPLSHS